MKTTNKHNLPAVIVQFLKHFDQQQAVEGLRVSTLIGSARVPVLKSVYFDKIETDVSDRAMTAFGSAVHLWFEHTVKVMQNPSVLTEQRLSVDAHGVKVTGQIDYQEYKLSEYVDKGVSVAIKDVKTCATYKIIKGDYKDWENQLNVYAWLVRHAKNLKVDSLAVIAFMKDWKANDKPDNPSCAAQEIPIKLWTEKEQDDYVEDRVRKHTRASFEHLPLCTDEERWLVDSRLFAVHENKNSRAKRLFATEEESEQYVGDNKSLNIQKRKPVFRKCAKWCDVSQFCDQYQEVS